MTSEKQSRLPCLDGIRAIGIGFVIMAHLENVLGWQPAGMLRFVWDNLGQLGVNIFFGLSGYLITYLLVKEFKRTGTVSLRNFYARRVLRIFPAFYVYMGVIAALVLAGVLDIPGLQMVQASVYLANYYFHHLTMPDTWFIGHTWSLAMEEQFYLFWPMLLLLVGLARSRWAALILIALMPVVRVATYYHQTETRPIIGMTIHTGADLLMFGCLLALVEGHPRFERGMAFFKSWLFPVGAALFLLLGHPFLYSRFWAAYKIAAGPTLVAACVAFIIAWLLRKPGSLGAAFLNSRVMMHLGVLSYSLYLWQQVFLTHLNKTVFGRFPFCLIGTYAAACASYYLIEKWFLNMRTRFR